MAVGKQIGEYVQERTRGVRMKAAEGVGTVEETAGKMLDCNGTGPASRRTREDQWRHGVGEASDTRYATPRLRRAVTRLLALETSGAPATPDTLAAAAGRLLDTLCRPLADVIGPDGVQSILLRAVRLVKSEFAFLDERIVPSEGGDSLAEPLRAALQEHEPDVIRRASVTLFATFLGLLANVIGDRLTWSLLQQTWPDTLLPRTDRQETEE